MAAADTLPSSDGTPNTKRTATNDESTENVIPSVTHTKLKDDFEAAPLSAAAQRMGDELFAQSVAANPRVGNALRQYGFALGQWTPQSGVPDAARTYFPTALYFTPDVTDQVVRAFNDKAVFEPKLRRTHLDQDEFTPTLVFNYPEEFAAGVKGALGRAGLVAGAAPAFSVRCVNGREALFVAGPGAADAPTPGWEALRDRFSRAPLLDPLVDNTGAQFPTLFCPSWETWAYMSREATGTTRTVFAIMLTGGLVPRVISDAYRLNAKDGKTSEPVEPPDTASDGTVRPTGSLPPDTLLKRSPQLFPIPRAQFAETSAAFTAFLAQLDGVMRPADKPYFARMQLLAIDWSDANQSMQRRVNALINGYTLFKQSVAQPLTATEFQDAFQVAVVARVDPSGGAPEPLNLSYNALSVLDRLFNARSPLFAVPTAEWTYAPKTSGAPRTLPLTVRLDCTRVAVDIRPYVLNYMAALRAFIVGGRAAATPGLEPVTTAPKPNDGVPESARRAQAMLATATNYSVLLGANESTIADMALANNYVTNGAHLLMNKDRVQRALYVQIGRGLIYVLLNATSPNPEARDAAKAQARRMMGAANSWRRRGRGRKRGSGGGPRAGPAPRRRRLAGRVRRFRRLGDRSVVIVPSGATRAGRNARRRQVISGRGRGRRRQVVTMKRGSTGRRQGRALY